MFRCECPESFVHDVGKDRVGYLAHTRLDGGFVLYQIGDEFTDCLCNVVGRLLYELQEGTSFSQRHRSGSHGRSCRPAYAACSGSPRHDIPGNLGSGLGNINRDPQAHIPLSSGGDTGDERNIDVHAATSMSRGISERKMACSPPAFLDGCTVFAPMTGRCGGSIRYTFFSVRGEPEIQKVDDLGICKVLCHIDEGLYQELGLPAR